MTDAIRERTRIAMIELADRTAIDVVLVVLTLKSLG